MKNDKNLKDYFIVKIAISILLIVCFNVALYSFLSMNSVNTYRYYLKKYSKGMIANDDLVLPAQFEIIDKKATEKKRAEAVSAVLPVFSFSVFTTHHVLSDFDNFIEACKTGNPTYITDTEFLTCYEKITGNKNLEPVFIAYEITKSIMQKGFFDFSELENFRKDDKIKISIFGGNVDSDNAEESVYTESDIVTDKNLFETVDLLLSANGYKLSDDNRYIIHALVREFCKVNISYDKALSDSRREIAFETCEPVIISMEKGKQLLKIDTVVTEEQIETLNLLSNAKTLRVFDVLSCALFHAICIAFIFFLICNLLKDEKLHSGQYMAIITFFSCINCVIIYFIRSYINVPVRFLPVLYPVCFLSIIITMLSGNKKLGYLVSIITALNVFAVPDSDFTCFFYCVFLGVASSHIVRFFNKRLDVFLQWCFESLAAFAVTLVFMYVGGYNFSDIIYVFMVILMNITAIHIILSVLVPIIEHALNLPTVYRLYELSYGNSALLEKLAQSAPGTYSHCRAVADLAADACKTIGANMFLARAGALYHDIGKTEHPEYFVENQTDNNKHDNLNPSLSVSIIKNHVKVGADKARDAGLPVEMIDIIANHHGNDVIQYFYSEAKKQKDEAVNSVDYSYNNSKIPQTKECAVVMLADSVEAAARTVQDPTIAKFTKLIESIILGKINRAQLNNCSLSMKEISAISESFLKTLRAQYHSRIVYPTEEE